MSPFCVKLETYLRMTKQEYKTANGNPLIAPKGKVPYIEIDGTLLGDSSLIIKHLKARFGDPLDKDLTREQRALAHAIQSLFEDRMYFGAAWLRWTEPQSWSYVRAVFKSLLPPIIGNFIIPKIRRKMMSSVKAQGTGRHSRDEIIQSVQEDLLAISDLLGTKPFMLGQNPTSIDATAYGFLVQQLFIPWDSPIKQYAQTLPNLGTYCERMKQRYWN